MSKLVLCYFLLSFALLANDATDYSKKATPRDFSPYKLSSASNKFYKGIDEFMKNEFTRSYDSFTSASKEKGISKDEQGVALYNAALSLEKAKKYEKAMKLYKDITKEELYTPLFKDSYYRIGACCHQLKNWTCVVESLNNWKNSQSAMALVEEFEFRVRKGTAYYELQSYRDVIDYLESAVKALKNQKSLLLLNAKNMGYNDDKINILGLWALEDLAKSYIKIGDNIKISYSTDDGEATVIDRLNKQVDLKAYYYLKGQDSYIEMLDHGDKDSAIKGLNLIGELYTNVYNNLLNSEVPPDIKEKKLENKYIVDFKEALMPLLKKAEVAYKKSAEVAIKVPLSH